MTAPESRIVERFADLYPDEVARIMESFSPEENAKVMDETSPARAVEVIRRLTLHAGAEVLQRLDSGQASRIVELLEPHRAAALLLRIPQEAVSRILDGASSGCQRELRMSMEYPPTALAT